MRLFPRKKAAGTALVVVVGDWHVNDTVAICPPRFTLDDGGFHQRSKGQAALWTAWLDFWEHVEERKRALNATCYVICNGDLGDINYHDGVQLITEYKPAILQAMADVARPAVEVADRIFLIRGTRAHVGSSGELEEWLAHDIAHGGHGKKLQRPPEHYTWWSLEAEFGGVRFDTTHHPPTASRRPWTRNAAAGRAAAITAGRYLEAGRRPPAVAVWSHVHYPGVGREMGVWGYFCPSWKLVGGYGYRIGMGAHVSPVGGLIFEIVDGRITNHGDDAFVLYHPKRRDRWTES